MLYRGMLLVAQHGAARPGVPQQPCQLMVCHDDVPWHPPVTSLELAPGMLAGSRGARNKVSGLCMAYCWHLLLLLAAPGYFFSLARGWLCSCSLLTSSPALLRAPKIGLELKLHGELPVGARLKPFPPLCPSC